MRRGHDQSPIRNDENHEVWPPGHQENQPPGAVGCDETTDNPERHSGETFKRDMKAACESISKQLNIPVDPWFHGIVNAIDQTSAVWTLSKGGDGEYLAIVEGNQMFPSPPAIRKAKTFSLALAWAFIEWLNQQEQD